MCKLLKSELTYNRYLLIALLSLPIIYTFFLAVDVAPFESNRFLGKYFWSGFIGLGTYLLIYVMWVQRIKENRDRLHSIIPVSIKQNARSRTLLGLLPFTVIVLYTLLIHFLVLTDQSDQTKRIFAQLGFMFIFLAHLLIWRDLWAGYSYKSETRKLLLVVSTAILMMVASIVALFFILIPLVDGIFTMSHEIIFMCWGLILCGISFFVFIKADNYAS